MIAFVPVTIVFGTLLPALSEAASSGDSAWFKRRFLQISLCAVIGGGSILAVMALNSNALIDLWLGGNMEPSSDLITVMGVYYELMLVQGACSTLLLALGKMKIQVITSMLSSVSSIVLAVILIPDFGALGAASASLVAFLILFVPQLLLSLSLLRSKSMHSVAS
jgi:O-antigen/teichoic acid export membrane protein